ncbi:MAG: Hsp33 family molecular chaperone HslO [Fibromonadales bacterium]|nr:Hsp33 family molecular chaperone HslO [Fibromonadales bacterium]
MSDVIIRATGTSAPFRFVLVSAKNTLNEIGKKHEATGNAMKFMAETAVASLLLSSGLKFPGTVCLQADAQADSTPQGLVRAKPGTGKAPQKMTVITLNEKSQRVKESIVEAPSTQMGVNLTAYLMQSEQTKSATGIYFDIGFLLEAYPDATSKDLEIMDAVIRNLPPLKNFSNVHDLLDQLRGPYEVEIVKEIIPQAYCPCSLERVVASLNSLHKSEKKEMLEKDEILDVVCDFCKTHYEVSPQSVFKTTKQ